MIDTSFKSNLEEIKRQRKLLKPQYIKKGMTFFGITGTYDGTELPYDSTTFSTMDHYISSINIDNKSYLYDTLFSSGYRLLFMRDTRKAPLEMRIENIGFESDGYCYLFNEDKSHITNRRFKASYSNNFVAYKSKDGNPVVYSYGANQLFLSPDDIITVNETPNLDTGVCLNTTDGFYVDMYNKSLGTIPDDLYVASSSSINSDVKKHIYVNEDHILYPYNITAGSYDITSIDFKLKGNSTVINSIKPHCIKQYEDYVLLYDNTNYIMYIVNLKENTIQLNENIENAFFVEFDSEDEDHIWGYGTTVRNSYEGTYTIYTNNGTYTGKCRYGDNSYSSEDIDYMNYYSARLYFANSKVYCLGPGTSEAYCNETYVGSYLGKHLGHYWFHRFPGGGVTPSNHYVISDNMSEAVRGGLPFGSSYSSSNLVATKIDEHHVVLAAYGKYNYSGKDGCIGYMVIDDNGQRLYWDVIDCTGLVKDEAPAQRTYTDYSGDIDPETGDYPVTTEETTAYLTNILTGFIPKLDSNYKVTEALAMFKTFTFDYEGGYGDGETIVDTSTIHNSIHLIPDTVTGTYTADHYYGDLIPLAQMRPTTITNSEYYMGIDYSGVIIYIDATDTILGSFQKENEYTDSKGGDSIGYFGYVDKTTLLPVYFNPYTNATNSYIGSSIYFTPPTNPEYSSDYSSDCIKLSNNDTTNFYRSYTFLAKKLKTI